MPRSPEAKVRREVEEKGRGRMEMGLEMGKQDWLIL